MEKTRKPGEILLQKIRDAGYTTYVSFCQAFTKATKVTLSVSRLGRYIRNTPPSTERFDALTEFLGFSPKEKEEIEGLYLGNMRRYKPEVHKRGGYSKKASVKKRKSPNRIPLVSGPGTRSIKPVKVKRVQTKKPVVKKTKKDLYAQLTVAYKTIMGKAPTKRAQVLLFELSLG